MYISDRVFREKALEGRTVQQNLRKQQLLSVVSYEIEKDAEEDERRALDFIISSETVDRMGDVITLKGWKLENYKNNPVVLFAHNSSEPPVARADSVRMDHKNKLLKSRAVFPPQDMNPLSDTLYNLYTQGFMKATSVGFRPLKYAWAKDEDGEWEDGREYGINFEEQELLEYSLVPVPANQDALQMALRKGVEMDPLRTWAESTLDCWEQEDRDVPMTRKKVEQIYKSLGGRVMSGSQMQEASERLRKANLERLRGKAPKPDTPVEEPSPNDGAEDSCGDGAERIAEEITPIDKLREPFTKSDKWTEQDLNTAVAKLPFIRDGVGSKESFNEYFISLDRQPTWDRKELWEAYVEAAERYSLSAADAMTLDVEAYREARGLCRELFDGDVTEHVFGLEVEASEPEVESETVVQLPKETETQWELEVDEETESEETGEEQEKSTAVLHIQGTAHKRQSPEDVLSAFIEVVDAMEQRGEKITVNSRRMRGLLRDTRDIIRDVLGEEAPEPKTEEASEDFDVQEVVRELFGSLEGKRLIETTILRELHKAQGRIE